MATIEIKSRSREKKGDARDEMQVIVGVTLAWRVIHSAPNLQINIEPTNHTARLKTDS